jgi:hypothetical protein
MATLLSLSQVNELYAGGPHARADRIARYYASQRPWHGSYSYTQWGGPVSLVVPPTARTQVSYSWGVSQTEVQPIYHQFHRDYPGPFPGNGSGVYAPNFLPTPYWPSHTDQLGVYPVRGPW